jgi:hypothetical protein
VFRSLALGIALGLLAGWLVRRVRGGGETADSWQPPSPPPADAVATASFTPAVPAEPVPPLAAETTDRERESRLDDETKYERSLEAEERERAAAAARLRTDPLVVDGPADETL